MKAEHEKAINSAVFPGLQGGPLMHVIAAKAVAFRKRCSRSSRTTSSRWSRTRACWPRRCSERGLRIVSGGTDNHLFLVDLRAKKITGKDAEAALGSAHITVNKNAIPNDPREAVRHVSGIRLGTPAMTTRGFKEAEVRAARAT